MSCRLFALAACLLVPIASPAQSTGWSPDKNVELVVGFPAGSAMDATARTIQRIWTARRLVNASSTVVNKPGGAGSLSMVYMAQRASDPHTLTVASSTLLTTRITGGSTANYTDLTPLALLINEYVAFTVKADSAITSGADLVERLRKDPRALSVAVGSGLGNSNHIALGLVMKAAGVDVKKLKVVSFNSAGEGMTALLGAHVDLSVGTLGVVLPQMENGQLRIIAIAAPQRLGGAAARVPTWKEQGVNVSSGIWRAGFGPRELTAPQIAFWEDAFRRMSNSEEWRAEADKRVWETTYRNSRDTRKFLDADFAELKTILTELGLAR